MEVNGMAPWMTIFSTAKELMNSTSIFLSGRVTGLASRPNNHPSRSSSQIRFAQFSRHRNACGGRRLQVHERGRFDHRGGSGTLGGEWRGFDLRNLIR